MLNAHLQIGKLEFLRTSQYGTFTEKAFCDRWVLDFDSQGYHRDKDILDAIMLSACGPDEVIAALKKAIVKENYIESTQLGSRRRIKLRFEEPHFYRGAIETPGHTRPLRHLLVISEKFHRMQQTMPEEGSGYVVMNSDPVYALYKLSCAYGLPVVPEWADYIMQEIQEIAGGVVRLKAFNIEALKFTLNKDRYMEIIRTGLKKKRLKIPGYSRIRWDIPSRFDAITPRALAA